MLADKDRIFTNLYGYQDFGLKAAQARGDWDKTANLILCIQQASSAGAVVVKLVRAAISIGYIRGKRQV